MSLVKIKTLVNVKYLLPVLLLTGFTVLFASAAKVYATHVCEPGTLRAGQAIPHVARQAENFCAGGGVSPQEAAAAGRLEVDCNSDALNEGNCGIVRYLVVFIRVLSVSVGIVVLIMIAWGGFMYASSRDNPQQSASAKDHIRNALIALLMYIFSVALINYLVPGGVF